jgi:glyoxylase-like metal-dependent hydrolase (beta-lactamase superfamily II)
MARRFPLKLEVEMAAQPQEIATGVYCLAIGKKFGGTNVYIVRSGPSWVLIDTAWPQSGHLIKEAAESLFGANARPASILLTHLHPDHVGSALELARMWNVPVYVHPNEMPLAAEEFPTEYANPLDRWCIFPLMRIWPPFATSVRRQAHESNLKGVVRAFDPTAVIPGLPDWSSVHTPGHTPGHVVFFRNRDRVMIAGDALLTININSVWDLLRNKRRISGPPYIATWNWPQAREAVAALAKLQPSVLACGHGVPMMGAEIARDLAAFADGFSRSASKTRTAGP